MTDIQKARDVLATWRNASDRLRPTPWSLAPLWSGVLIADSDGSQINSDDQEDAAEFNGPVAALIVGTAGNPDLLDAIDYLLDMGPHFQAGGWLRQQVQRIAAAIIAADERMNA